MPAKWPRPGIGGLQASLSGTECFNTLSAFRQGPRLSAGEGVPHSPQLAVQLYKRAAELGHPDAQADVAFRWSTGLEPNRRPGSGLDFTLGEQHMPEALLSYYFAAASNQTGAQMVLGYRSHARPGMTLRIKRAAVTFCKSPASAVMSSFVAGFVHAYPRLAPSTYAAAVRSSGCAGTCMVLMSPRAARQPCCTTTLLLSVLLRQPGRRDSFRR